MEQKRQLAEVPQAVPACMFHPASPTYDQQFPRLGQLTDGEGRHTYAFKVPNLIGRDEKGNAQNITTGEVVLNWQSENAAAQNRVLSSIETRVDLLATQTKSTSPPKGNIVFTLDNILYSKWLNRLHEFLAYFSQGALVTQNNHDILADFVARFVEILRNWWTIMGEADKFLKHGPLKGLYKPREEESSTAQSMKFNEEARLASIVALKVLTDSDSDFSKPKFDTCYIAAEVTREVNLVNIIPDVLISIYSSKYAKPIKVIAFLDTGAAYTIMNLEVLPIEYWKTHTKHFNIASTEVLGSTLPRKEIVVGWDVITRMAKFRMTLEGVRFKQYFQPDL
ncbi:hypothetical protein CRG98_039119 [Punica granatum]|uniref:Uncharacterized protein n=1 Tax=Punica granatum TaxID=22663 RepID=A0A2I0I9K4_PUNGR|nr:hypothetical protein CRG98_039119 [Punica granatum]